MKVGEL